MTRSPWSAVMRRGVCSKEAWCAWVRARVRVRGRFRVRVRARVRVRVRLRGRVRL